VGGTVSGLASGGTVVLQNNGGNNVTVNANGAFTFGSVNNGGNYAVSVLTNPTTPGPGQSCSVTNGSGTVNGSNISNITVTCVNTDQTAPGVVSRTPLPTSVGTKVTGAVVTVTFSEAIDPATVTASSFTVAGSAGPVTGTISFANGNTQAIFTPASTLAFDDNYTVTVTTGVKDPSSNPLSANATWSFNSGKKLAFGFKHTCARMDDGGVKCWGNNVHGQLGYNDNDARGNGTGEQTSALLPVHLGAGRTAVALTAGDWHTCAILDNGDTKCWGRNGNGELGQGTVTPTGNDNNVDDNNEDGLGNAAGEMEALQPINLGTGRTALEIAGGQHFTCARLDDSSVKCWGRNETGQLGQGNSTQLGVTANDIAGAAPLSFGTGLTPVAISLGHHHGCATLTDSAGARHVKCWGDNRWGQLGLGLAVTEHKGDAPNEMGDALTEVDLGTGRFSTYLMANGGHNCAVLDDKSTRCWGLNGWGQIGLNVDNSQPVTLPQRTACNVNANDCIGDAPGEMGDALVAAISAGNTARISIGYRHSCALLVGGELKCWGTNEQAQLGIGNNAGSNDIIGNQTGEMTAPAAAALRSTAPIEEFTAGGFHSCVFHTDNTLNCWGLNDSGQLGRNDNETVVGDSLGEMGAGLIDVNLGQ
jgi:alpha-tubulin suppressor-like RCC1 family protein